MEQDYNLVDIHFHTNDSFDAYENNNGALFKWDELLNEEEAFDQKNKIKLIVKSDHNILNYKKYRQDKIILKSKGITYLPGIEINGKSKVHWIFVFNDIDLDLSLKSKVIGDMLDEKIQVYYGYSNIVPSCHEMKKKQADQKDIGEFIDILNELSIKFIAIPHLDKTGGWYDKMKKNPEEFEVVLKFLNDNIISGFESKHQNEFLKKHIRQTEFYIDQIIESIKSTDELNLKEIERRLNHKKFLITLEKAIQRNNISIVRGSDYHGEYNGVKGGLRDYHNFKDELFYMKSECTFEGLRYALLDQDSRTFSRDKLSKYLKNPNTWIRKIEYMDSFGQKKSLKFKDGINSIIGARGTGKSYLISAMLGKMDNYATSSIVNDINITKIIYANGDEFSSLPENAYDIVFQKNRHGDNTTTQIHDILAKAPYDVNIFIEKIKEFSAQHKEIDNFSRINDYFKLLNDVIARKKSLYNHITTSSIDYSFFNDYNTFISNVGQSAFWKGHINDLITFLNSKFTSKKENILEVESISKELISLNERIDKTKSFLEVEKEEKSLEIFTQYSNVSTQLIELYEKSIREMEKNKNQIEKVNVRMKSMSRNLGDSLTNEEKSFEEKTEKLVSFIKGTFRLIRSFNELNQKLELDKKDKISNESTFEFVVNYDIYRIKTIQEIDFLSLDQSNIKKVFNNFSVPLNKDEFKEIRYGKLSLDLIERLMKNHDRRRKSTDLELPSLFESIKIKVNDEPYKDILKMSQGERSDLLLQMVLNQNTDKVLILDQPEDDLDNETVFKTLLVKLRELKLRRQIFIVTHNANICINSDSDTITTCENSGGKFKLNVSTMESTDIFSYSSINSKLNGRQIDIAVNILEGGKAALRKRVKTIGYRDLFFEETMEV